MEERAKGRDSANGNNSHNIPSNALRDEQHDFSSPTVAFSQHNRCFAFLNSSALGRFAQQKFKLSAPVLFVTVCCQIEPLMTDHEQMVGPYTHLFISHTRRCIAKDYPQIGPVSHVLYINASTQNIQITCARTCLTCACHDYPR